VFARLRDVSNVLITTDVSKDVWGTATEIRENICNDDIVIEVYDGGSKYKVNGTTCKAYSDEEEEAGLDRGVNAAPKAKVAASGQVISWEEAPSFVGQKVAVRGKIVNVMSRPGKPAYLDFSKTYWRDLSAIVFPDKLQEFPDLKATYENKTVTITGEITKYRGKPQIRLQSPAQVKVVP
jgi:hypothetical protein